MSSGRDNSAVFVTLTYSPLGLIGAKATDLQTDGLCVDTGAVSLPHHSEVEVTLSYRRDNRLQVHRATARVTGRTSRGTRLTFRQTTPEITSAMQELQSRQGTALEGVA